MTDGFQHDGLRGGVWHGSFDPGPQPGPMALVHLGERVGEPVITAAADGRGWRMAVPLPLDRLADGTTTFLLVEDDGSVGLTGARLIAALPLLAGAPLDADLRMEIDLLRAELELLKREFRREAAQTAARAATAAAASATAADIPPVVEAPKMQQAAPSAPVPIERPPVEGAHAAAAPSPSATPVLGGATLGEAGHNRVGPGGTGPDKDDPAGGTPTGGGIPPATDRRRPTRP